MGVINMTGHTDFARGEEGGAQQGEKMVITRRAADGHDGAAGGSMFVSRNAALYHVVGS